MRGKFIILEAVSLDIQCAREIVERIEKKRSDLPIGTPRCTMTLDTSLTIVSDPINMLNNYKHLVYKDYRLMNMLHTSSRYINYILMNDEMDKGTSFVHQGGFINTIANEAVKYIDNKKLYLDAIKFGIEEHVRSCRNVAIPDAHFYIYMDPGKITDYTSELVGDISFNIGEVATQINDYEKSAKAHMDVIQTYERVTGDQIKVIYWFQNLERKSKDQVVDEIWSDVEPLFQEEK